MQGPTDIDCVKSLKGIKIVHLNVRSILRHWEEFEQVFLDGRFDVVVVTETWLHQMIDSNLVSAPGYKLFRLDRQAHSVGGSKKCGGGIAIYIKNLYDVTVKWDSNVSTNDLELAHVVLKRDKLKSTDVFALYRPPSGNFSIALEHLQSCLENSPTPGERVMIGDFNIDISKGNCPKVKKLFKLCSNWNLESHIESNTRITNKSATCIDLIYSDIRYVSCSGCINVNISDHLPTYLVKKKSKSDKSFVEIVRRSVEL